ncbi:hypothetical protein SCUCBS95973_006731 [Sporothrix curviconia]|uniref:Uncharacterized protein n=1 Tax=Sporothrix curviconia TaxID=1260050 RepID=A0ABP0CA23_9PEZI
MAAEEATRPRILMISLDYRPFFDELYAPLLTELGSKASLQRVKKAQPAIRLLAEQPQLSVVLITDEALTVTANARVWEAVLQYVRQGGTAVIMGHFPTYVKPLSVKPFFAKAGLPWESGSYHRTTLVLNRDAVTNDLATKLPPQYSQKAVHVKNVASADAWRQSRLRGSDMGSLGM